MIEKMSINSRNLILNISRDAIYQNFFRTGQLNHIAWDVECTIYYNQESTKIKVEDHIEIQGTMTTLGYITMI